MSQRVYGFRREIAAPRLAALLAAITAAGPRRTRHELERIDCQPVCASCLRKESPVFKITPDPTFDLPVPIPSAGAEPVLITLVVNRWTRTRLRAETEGEIDFDKVVHAATVGWRDADKPFSVEALSGFLEDYPLASRAIATEFLAAQTQAKQKN